MDRKHRWTRAVMGVKVLLGATTMLATPAWAQDATWAANPTVCPGVTRCDYNAAANWGPAGVPTGTATFGATTISDIEFVNPVGSPPIVIGRFHFTSAAPAYTFRLVSDELTFTGEGIVNNSTATQTLISGNRSTLRFANSSSAGNAALVAEGSGGVISFEGSSTAGTSVITIGASGFGTLNFSGTSTAANATISNPFGNINFFGNSTAGNASITNIGGMIFRESSSLGTATITNRTGLGIFNDASGAGGTIINETGGVVDISQVAGGAASTSIGSLSGAGNIRLGGRNLTLGALNRTETISGAISDGGERGGAGGSLTKIGNGTLTLTGASTYTGATTANGGTLLLTGSITGAGATTIGSGSGSNGRLTIQGNGALTSTGAAVIGAFGGTGNVLMTGAGSRWTIGGGLSIGIASTGGASGGIGRLTIENGATVTGNGALLSGNRQDGTDDGRAIVTGAGSVWNSGALSMFSSRTPALLTIAAGGAVNSTNAGIAAAMLVTGPGSVWNSGALIIGPNVGANGAPRGDLRIADGAVVNSTSVVVNDDKGGLPSVVIVEGAGSIWNMTSNLVAARQAIDGAFITIRNGGRVNVADGTGAVLLGTAGGLASLTIGGGAPGTTAGTLNAASVQTGGNAILSFEYAGNTSVFAPVITGSGRVFVGSGTTILAANSTSFTGTTTIFAGATLQFGSITSCCGGGVVVQNGGETGSLSGAIVNNGALVISRMRTLALDGIISGTGSLTQNGTVTTTMSAANTYSGATVVNGGTLLVTGSIGASSSVTINGGGILGGTGTVARTIVNGGIVAPGLSIGTLNVAGNLTLTNGNLSAEVGPTSADLFNVTGTASLSGRLVAIATGGNYGPGQHVLLTAAGGRSGTFSTFGLVGNFGGLFATLSYTANNVVLNLSEFNATGEERWLAAPATNLWNTGSNWNPDAVPIGTARFGPSTRTTLVFAPGTTQIGRLLFDADVPAYTFNLDTRILSQGGGSSLNILGEGIVNNSASRPSIFVTSANSAINGAARLNFFNASTAGNAHIFNASNANLDFATHFYGTSSAANALIDNGGPGTAFHESSTAGNATINNGDAISVGGATAFLDNSSAGTARISNLSDLGGVGFFGNATAAQATIINRASSSNLTATGLATVAGVNFSGSSMAGSANITNEAGGNTAFLGTSTAASANIVNSGAGNFSFSTLFGDNSSAGSATITNNQGGITRFQQTATAATAAIINNQGGSTSFFQTGSVGTPTVTNNSGGTTFFRQRAQGDGVTIVNNAGGSLDISEDPQQAPAFVDASVNIGSLSGTGNVLLGARNLSLGGMNRDETIGGLIADGGQFGGTGGSLTKTGTGTLILTGGNSYTGATTIGAGTLQLGDGGAAGSLAGNIANNAAFVINRTGALALAGIISGNGSFTQNGGVTTTLSGLSTYTGATRINGGSLLVTGSIAASSLLTVNSGATLGGTGTVGTTLIASGGTLSPGLSVGTLTVQGNLSFAPGSNFLVEIGPATADRVNVTGTASLTGTLTALSLGGTFSESSQYTLLLAAGGITGTFNQLVTQGSFGNLVPRLTYSGNSVILGFAVGGGGGPTNTATTTFTDALIFNAPTITVQRVNLFQTRIIGRLAGGAALFDQTFNDVLNSGSVQAGLLAARAAITAAGGPGIVIISDPVLLSRVVTQVASSSSQFSLAGTSNTVTTITTFGPATITIGDARSCGTIVADLPGATRPACGTPGGTTFAVEAGSVNINSNTRTDYFINEARTDTTTETTVETYELTGTVAAIGTIYGAVQSSVFDLASRFLGRIGGEGSPGLFGETSGGVSPASALAPERGAHSTWAEVYGFRNRNAARGGIAAERRDAFGFAGGFSLGVGANLRLGFGLDHGRLDLEVPGAGERADVELTQLAATARLGFGALGLAIGAVHGFGSVDGRRTLLGATASSYDVSHWGFVAEASYLLQAGSWRIVPRLMLDHVRMESDAFTERGAFALAVPAASRSRTRAAAGLEIGRSFATGAGGRIDLAATARYVAVLEGEERTLPVAFTLAPGAALVMRGLTERDSLALGGQLGVQLSPALGLYLAYEGRFASGYDAHAAAAGLRISW